MGELIKTFNNERARTDLDDGAVTQRSAAENAGIRELKAGGMGILKIGRTLGVGTSVVQRVMSETAQN
jgi:hypothetical protein